MKKDFLSFEPFAKAELQSMLDLSIWVKKERPRNFKPLADKTAALIFEKPSLRTHVSFEVGILQLGGQSVYLAGSTIGINTRESIKDVAVVLSQYNDVIVIRTFSHAIVEQLAAYASIPVINALTDLLHPCQVMADAMTLMELGRFSPSTKIVFVGDGNNMVNSWLELAAKFPFHFVIAAPAGYDPDPAILNRAQHAGVSAIEIVHDPLEAATDADVLYTDVWVSMGQEEERAARTQAFNGYQINAALLKRAQKDCVVMHCLPAHRGEEITSDVLEGSQSVVLPQAQNRLHVQKGILAYLHGARMPARYEDVVTNEPVFI
jgi:ornithine carbamoyltransferase